LKSKKLLQLRKKELLRRKSKRKNKRDLQRQPRKRKKDLLRQPFKIKPKMRKLLRTTSNS